VARIWLRVLFCSTYTPRFMEPSKALKIFCDHVAHWAGSIYVRSSLRWSVNVEAVSGARSKKCISLIKNKLLPSNTCVREMVWLISFHPLWLFTLCRRRAIYHVAKGQRHIGAGGVRRGKNKWNSFYLLILFIIFVVSIILVLICAGIEQKHILSKALYFKVIEFVKCYIYCLIINQSKLGVGHFLSIELHFPFPCYILTNLILYGSYYIWQNHTHNNLCFYQCAMRIFFNFNCTLGKIVNCNRNSKSLKIIKECPRNNEKATSWRLVKTNNGLFQIANNKLFA